MAVAGAGAQEVRHFNKKNAAVRLTRNPGQLCGQSCPGAGAALGQGRKGASPDLEAPRLYPVLAASPTPELLRSICAKLEVEIKWFFAGLTTLFFVRQFR